MFENLYRRVLSWAAHRYAPFYLGLMSFAESIFFPIPPDVMLMPMAMAKPKKWWHYALITTIGSILGAIIGYFLGYFLFDSISPWIEQTGHMPTYELVVEKFDQYGFWIIFLAGFSPLPYKLFTVAAGALVQPFFPFLLASFIGRGARFFLVSALIAYGGKRIEPLLLKYIERIGWALVAIVGVGIILYGSMR